MFDVFNRFGVTQGLKAFVTQGSGEGEKKGCGPMVITLVLTLATGACTVLFS